MIQDFGKYGIFTEGNTTMTFEMLASADQTAVNDDKETFQSLFKVGEAFALGDYTIASNGDDNNLPGEVRDFIKYNHLLPEILKKQARFMYGQGPMLYIEEYDEDNRKIRKPVDKIYPEVFEWLESWKKAGLSSASDYLRMTIQSYYYSEDYYSGWHLNKSRRVNSSLPIRGLKHLSSVKCRKGLKGKLNNNERITDERCNYIIVGRWDEMYKLEFDVYPRLDPTDALKHGYAVNYTGDFGFDEEIYAKATFFYGLKEWIRGSNLNPKYVNSYLKNSLNAKIHVKVPNTWVTMMKDQLEDICKRNLEREEEGKELITEFEGLTNIGTSFNYGMLRKLVDLKLQQVSKVLSGEGENQGKTFWSRTFMTQNHLEEWKFEEIPVKYKEFVTSILEYDKRAVSVILEGKGLDPSISNISNEGIHGGSGSQAYYNYLIYLESLPFAEEIICEEINMALRINFPRLKKDKVRLGFYRHIPQRIEETPPKDRIDSIKK